MLSKLSIKVYLFKPDSYQQGEVVAWDPKKRTDGSEYYEKLRVDFHVANALGGLVPHQAIINLVEDRHRRQMPRRPSHRLRLGQDFCTSLHL